MSDQDNRPNSPASKPSQAEGERDKTDNSGGTSGSGSPSVTKKPSQAEGDEKTVDEALKNQQKKP